MVYYLNLVEYLEIDNNVSRRLYRQGNASAPEEITLCEIRF